MENQYNKQFVVWKNGQTVEKILCTECGVNWISKHSTLCKSCNQSGANNNFYHKTHSMKTKMAMSLKQKSVIKMKTRYFCVDCGIEVGYRSKRCCKCHARTIIGECNPSKRLDVRQKIRERLSGEGNGSWCGGLSRRKYHHTFNDELKKWIRGRDLHTCVLCETKEKLCVHHIDYNKLNSSTNNLITLCISCNAKVNTHRHYWCGWFQERCNRRLRIYEYSEHEIFIR